MLCPDQRQQTSLNTNHNKRMITAAPSLDATKGALPHKKGLAGHFPQEYPELHLPGLAAFHILYPQPLLQHLELSFSHQVRDQPHLPPAAEPQRVEQKAPCQPCLFMLSQAVSTWSFVLPVPGESPGKGEVGGSWGLTAAAARGYLQLSTHCWDLGSSTTGG